MEDGKENRDRRGKIEKQKIEDGRWKIIIGIKEPVEKKIKKFYE